MAALRILVLGSGGREHALVWKLSQSSLVDQIFVSPGNGGTSQVPKAKNISVGANTFDELVAFALKEKVSYFKLELPLTLLTDTFRYPSSYQDQSSLW